MNNKKDHKRGRHIAIALLGILTSKLQPNDYFYSYWFCEV